MRSFLITVMVLTGLHALDIEKVLINPIQPISVPPLEDKYLDEYSFTSKKQNVKKFLISKYEMNVQAYKHFLESTEEHKQIIALNMEFLEEQEPITNVSFSQAAEACRFYGGRLPTELEWSVAASIKLSSSTCYEHLTYGAFYPYPTQLFPLDDDSQLTQCILKNDDEFEPSLLGREFLDVQDSVENINGTYGMLGNVNEWVDSSKKYFYQTYRVIKGGSFANSKQSIFYDSRVSNILKEDAKMPNVGFRCVWDVTSN